MLKWRFLMTTKRESSTLPTNFVSRQLGNYEVRAKAVYPPKTITTQEQYYSWLQQQTKKPAAK
jgi:hypothetical protein